MSEELRVLIIRSKNGEKEAFGEIYNQFLRRIYRFVYFLVGSQELSEDLTQETFLKAWKALPNFSLKRGTIQAFLFSIARNLVTDYRRRKKTISLDLNRMEEIDPDENVEEKIIEKEEGKQIYKALLKLKDIERQIIILRYFEELSFVEVAQAVDMKDGAVRVRIGRILRKLKKILE